MSAPAEQDSFIPPATATWPVSRSVRAHEVLGILPRPLAALLAARDAAAQEIAWGEFLDAYSGLLLETAYHLGRSYDGALDRYAFLLEQLRRDDYRRLREFAAEGPSRFSSWLAVVARRLCLDRARQHYGRRRPSMAERARANRATRRRLADLVAERIDVTCLADEGQANPETQLAAAERSRTLEAVVRRLSPRSRLLLKLRFERDLPAREIADLLGLPSQFHVYRELKTLLGALRRALQVAGVEGANS